MPTIMRKFEFDAAHRIWGHETKCKYLHGHRYVAEVTVQAPVLDQLGRVLDFGVIKSVVSKWIDEYWDHNILLHPDDPLVSLWRHIGKVTYGDGKVWDGGQIFGREPFIFPRNTNPTAENIAQFLFHRLTGLLPQSVTLLDVRIWETPNCCADYPDESR